MPALRNSHQPSRRDSWPPTQMRLHRSIEVEDTPMGDTEDLSFIDDDPLHYFLTPSPLLDDSDNDEEDFDMEMDLDLDAGIEDVNRPVPIIRSVSPSSLDGGLSPPPKSPPSRNSPEVATPGSNHDDDDDEDYIRFSTQLEVPAGFNLPASLHNLTTKSKSQQTAREERDRMAKFIAADALLSPSSFHVGRPPSARGRPIARPNLARRPKSWSGPGHRSSLHAWREPSPDVWSIEEETEEELGEMGGSTIDLDAVAQDKKKTKAAKPKKTVRFALPVTEEIP